MLKPLLPTSTKWLGPDFSITVIVFTGPSLPELDATANAPPPTTNATTPATPAVVRSLRSMIPPPVVGWSESKLQPARGNRQVRFDTESIRDRYPLNQAQRGDSGRA